MDSEETGKLCCNNDRFFTYIRIDFFHRPTAAHLWTVCWSGQETAPTFHINSKPL